MLHYNLNITTIPTYNDGIFFLYNLSHEDKIYPTEYIKLLYKDPFSFNEISLTDAIIFENDKRDKKILKKIRIPQDKEINSRNILKIDGVFYQVFNIYHFKNKDGFFESDITLQEYHPTKIVEKEEDL